MTIPNSPYNAMLEGQNSSALLQLSNKTASTVGNTASNLTPYQQFGLKLMEMLKQQQQMGTKPFLNAQLQGQQEQAQRIMAPATPGMSPSQQSQVRNASAAAMTPTIEGAENMGKTFGEQISGIGNAIDSARAFLSDIQTQQEATKTQAQDYIWKIASSGLVNSMDPKELDALAKTAGYGKDVLSEVSKRAQQENDYNKKIQDLELRLKQQSLNQGPAGGGVGIAGATFEERLKQEIDNALSGTYGNKAGSGIREQIINNLATEFSKVKDLETIKKLVYSRLPNDWEANVKSNVKAPTADQSKAISYAKRMSNDHSIINQLESTISKLSGISFLTQSSLPYMAKSTEMKKLDQAERDFINAVLRRESGAAIAESEFDSAAKQYFPQPGDDEQLLTQKRRAREISIKNLFTEGGDADLPVKDKKTGQTGWIPANEFDPLLYEIIQ